MGERGHGCKKRLKGNELKVPEEENLKRKTEAEYWEAFWAEQEATHHHEQHPVAHGLRQFGDPGPVQ